MNGGELYLGGEAREYLPYLVDDPVISHAWQGIQHLALYGDTTLAGLLSDRLVGITLQTADNVALTPSSLETTYSLSGYGARAEYAGGIVLETRVCFMGQDNIALEWCLSNTGLDSYALKLSFSGDFLLPRHEAATVSVDGPIVSIDLSDRVKRPAFLSCKFDSQPGLDLIAEGQAYGGTSAICNLVADFVCRGSVTVTLNLESADVPGDSPNNLPPDSIQRSHGVVMHARIGVGRNSSSA